MVKRKIDNKINTRSRTKKGKFVAKRSDTKISTIEKKYGVDLGVRSDMRLGSYLKKKGYSSLAGMMRDN